VSQNGNGDSYTDYTLAKARERMDRFIERLRDSGNVRASCQAAGIPRITAYYWRKKYVTFAKQWDQAKEDACDVLEMEAWRRAMKENSDRLLIFLLKAHRRDVYGDVVRQEIAGAGEDGAIVIELSQSNISPEDI